MVTICLGAYLSEISIATLHAKEVTLAVNGLLAYKHIRISISWPFKDPLQRKCFTNSRNVSNALEKKNEVLPFLYSHKTNVSENDLFVLNVVCAMEGNHHNRDFIRNIQNALSEYVLDLIYCYIASDSSWVVGSGDPSGRLVSK